MFLFYSIIKYFIIYKAIKFFVLTISYFLAAEIMLKF